MTKDTTEVPTGNKTTENWLFLGKTNPHKMFDEKYKSRTVKESGNLVVTIKMKKDGGNNWEYQFITEIKHSQRRREKNCGYIRWTKELPDQIRGNC